MSRHDRPPRDAVMQALAVDDPELGAAILFAALAEVARQRPAVMGALVARLADADYCRVPREFLR